MNPLPTMTLMAALMLGGAAIAAEPCEAPGARDLRPLQVAISSDETVAAAFEATANACPPVPLENCDAQKLKCGEALTQNLQKVINFDEGAWLRDMLLPYLGQTYKASVVLPTVVTPATDVSCAADHLTLRAAAQRRRQQAERRKLVYTEYGKWVAWSSAVRQACVDRTKTQKAADDQTRAEAARLAAAAAALKASEETRQAELRKAEELRQAEIKRQAQAIEDAKKAKEKREADAVKDAERRKVEAEAAAKLAEEQRVISEREGKKKAQEQRVEQLKDQEEQRRLAAADALAAAKLRAEADHQQKIDALKKDLALSEEQKAKAVDDEQKKFQLAEEARRRTAETEISKAAKIDRSDERLRGNLAIHAIGGIGLLSTGSTSGVSAALGGYFRGRFGIWATAPADGMASGFEVKIFAQLLGVPGTDTLAHFEGGGELRGWFRRISLGLSASADYLGTTHVGADGNAVPLSSLGFALGPSVTLAVIDDPNNQFLIGVRWIPTFTGELVRFASEFEIAFQWFSMTLQAGIEQDSKLPAALDPPLESRLGFWAVLGVGGRFRW